MLNRLKLSTQIMLLPTVATTAFCLLLLVNLFLGQYSKHLDKIANEFLPAIETSRDLEEIMKNLQRTLQDAVAAADVDALQQSETLRDSFLRRLDEDTINSPQQAIAAQQLRTSFQNYYKTAKQTSEDMVVGAEGEDFFEALKTMSNQYKDITNALQQSTQQARADMQKAIDAAHRDNQSAVGTNIAISVISLIVIMLLAMVLRRGTVKTLDETVAELSAAAAEILAIAKQTELNAADEASAVDETQQTMDSLLEAANEISEAARSVLSSSERSTESSSTVAERIAKLNTQALRITDISDTIQTIADKSDILALNASLEGAKAGAEGRGFVLVGSEMRRLAEMVTNAVQKIKRLTHEIRDLSQAAVLAAEEGQRLAIETTEASRRISTITQHQSSGTEQINQSMIGIQEFTQQALAGARQSTSTANDLVRTADDLNRILEGSPQSSSGAIGSGRR